MLPTMQKRIKENVALLLRIEPECPLGLGSLKSTERAKKLVHDIGLIQRWLEKGASRDSNPGPCPWAARGDDPWEYTFSLLVAQKAPVRAGYTVLLCKFGEAEVRRQFAHIIPGQMERFLEQVSLRFSISRGALASGVRLSCGLSPLCRDGCPCGGTAGFPRDECTARCSCRSRGQSPAASQPVG